MTHSAFKGRFTEQGRFTMTALRTATAVWLTAGGLAVAQDAAKRGYLGVGTASAGVGERVVAVDPLGPAAAAGLKAGDVIVKLDNLVIDAVNTLRVQLNSRKTGQSVSVTFRDAAGNLQTRNVTLRDRSAADPAQPRSLYRLFDDDEPVSGDIVQMQFLQPPGPRPMLGVTVLDATPEFRERLKLGNATGVIISEVRPNTPAADAKLQVNDFVQAIDNRPVTSAAEVQQIIGSTKPDTPVKLKVLRNGQAIEVPVTVKSLAMPGMPGPQRVPGMGGMGGMMGPGVNADLVNQVNELRQRVQMLEARVQQLEARAGGTLPPSGTAPGGSTRPATKGPPVPRGGGSPPDR